MKKRIHDRIAEILDLPTTYAFEELKGSHNLLRDVLHDRQKRLSDLHDELVRVAQELQSYQGGFRHAAVLRLMSAAGEPVMEGATPGQIEQRLARALYDTRMQLKSLEEALKGVGADPQNVRWKLSELAKMRRMLPEPPNGSGDYLVSLKRVLEENESLKARLAKKPEGKELATLKHTLASAGVDEVELLEGQLTAWLDSDAIVTKLRGLLDEDLYAVEKLRRIQALYDEEISK